MTQYRSREGSVARKSSPAPPIRRDLSLRLATVLGVWSLLYMLPHLYWSLGGTMGFSVLKPSAVLAPEWRLANGVAAVMMTLAALIGFGLIHFGRNRLPRVGLLSATLVGASVSASHGVYGIVYRTLNVIGVIDIDGRPFEAEAHGWVLWDLFVIEPWFLIEGILLGLVGRAFVGRPSARRKWTLACAAGFSLAMLSAFIGVRAG